MTDTQTRPTAATPDPRPPELPKLGVRGALRFLWAQLSSMRTALVLLFALAVSAIPGSVIPQSKISPVQVNDFIAAHPTLGPIYEKVGLFDVYSSPWFSAIYLLLFVSLIGCIVPRIGVYARALRNRPPGTPRNLHRLPAYAKVTVADSDDTVVERAAALLKQQRYRVDVHGQTVAAERGYLREAGNLVFHVSLLFVLAGVAIGGLYGFRGTSVVIVGQGFSNNVTQYDDLSAGAWFKTTDLTPFNVTVKDFQVKFETGNVQRGAARLFKADVEVTDTPGATPRETTLQVNKPLNINGSTVHLIGHGYAPEVTVKDAEGNIAFSGPVVFLPQDGNFKSAGVVKAPDARPERLAFEGFFLPTGVLDSGGPQSVFPDALNPAMFLNVWYGPPKVETGRPENVYSLDRTGMTQLKDKNGDFVRFPLQPGVTATLPEGKGTITMDGWTRWVKLQVGNAPGVPISLVAIGFAVLGLCLSLFIRPRRVWLRASRSEDGSTLLEVGGLDRADARAGLTEDVSELAAELADGSQRASSSK